jgi:hypothetical protein
LSAITGLEAHFLLITIRLGGIFWHNYDPQIFKYVNTHPSISGNVSSCLAKSLAT